MTLPYDTPPPRRERALIREVAAVVILLLGVIGYVGAGFAESVHSGITRLSLLAIAAGVALGITR